LETFPDIKRDYIDPGRVRYVFFDFVLDPEHTYAQAAAEAAHCAAEQGKYSEFRQQLYRNQKALAPMFLQAHAETVGIQVTPFRECVESARYRTKVQADLHLSKTLRIRGTPTFFLGHLKDGGRKAEIAHRISGSRPFELFAEHFDALETKHAQLGLN
jgi:protein-disulfide isomerase